ncbi:MAG TPA: ABC transporter permease [Alphaproteobacteria bacterium]|nr:ABC transporter permease [Alphaproteobacteria bacterium]
MNVINIICRNLLYLLIISLVLFLIFTLLPGDAASFVLGVEASPETLHALQRQMGLDLPILERYLYWLAHFFVGNWGFSYITQSSVAALIGDKILVSFLLALYAMMLALIISFPLSILSAAKIGKAGGYLVSIWGHITLSIPSFWLGFMLIIVFSFDWGIFPASASLTGQDGFINGLYKLFLPAMALAIPQSSAILKLLRASLIATQKQAYIVTAKAKGLSDIQILYRHRLVNALPTVVTNMGGQFSLLLVGGIIVENLFRIPGIGRQLLSSVEQRDIPVIQAILVVLVAIALIANVLSALCNHWIDPRPSQD